MGTKEVMILLPLITVIFYSRRTESALPLGLDTLNLEDKNVEPKAELKHLGNNENGETVIAHHERKLEGAYGSRGVNGGQPAGNAGEGNSGGGSNSPRTQGGAAVIPLYAAGAGSNIHRNNHHRSASCLQTCRNSPALAATILLAYLLRYMYI